MNILFLISRHYYECKMDRCRFLQMEAVGRCNGMQVQMWGKGFPGYDAKATLWTNIQRAFGGTAFDLVHVYKPKDHLGVAACPVPKSVAYNEAWDNRAVIREVVRHDLRLLIFHHANDLQALSTSPRLHRGRTMVHLPHCAEQTIFTSAAQPWETRSIPLLLTGSINPVHYPFRARFAQLIRDGHMPGEIRPKPPGASSGLSATQAQLENYAQQLGRTRCAVVTSSAYHYALAKYAETAMAGCLLVGNVPAELHPTLGQHMVRLDPTMSDAQLVAQVRWWIEHDDQAQALAAANQQVALQHFTMEHYAARFVRAAQDFLDRQRSSDRVTTPSLRGRLQGLTAWWKQR